MFKWGSSKRDPSPDERRSQKGASSRSSRRSETGSSSGRHRSRKEDRGSSSRTVADSTVSNVPASNSETESDEPSTITSRRKSTTRDSPRATRSNDPKSVASEDGRSRRSEKSRTNDTTRSRDDGLKKSPRSERPRDDDPRAYRVDEGSSQKTQKSSKDARDAAENASGSRSERRSSKQKTRSVDDSRADASDGQAASGQQQTSQSNRIPNQFPDQTPLNYASSALPGQAGFGAAADYYGDQGQSVAHQPGVRPGTPIIVGAEPHLQPASAVPAPPQETGHGSAAEFYNSSNQVTQTTSSASASSTKPSKMSLGASSGAASTGRPPSTSAAQSSPTNTGRPSKASSRPSKTSTAAMAAGAAGAVGLAATALSGAGSHKTSNSNQTSEFSSNQTGRPSRPSASVFQSTTVSGGHSSSHQHTHHSHAADHHEHSHPPGAFNRLASWWNDYEDVAKMEAYTEYIGVCKHCFDPHSSIADAPRPHRPRRIRSRESIDSIRVDKDRRYRTTESSKRRQRRDASWLGAGLAGIGLVQAARAVDGNSSDSSTSSGRASPKLAESSRTRKQQGSASAGRTSQSYSRRPASGSTSRQSVAVENNLAQSNTGPNVDRRSGRTSSHAGGMTSTSHRADSPSSESDQEGVGFFGRIFGSPSQKPRRRPSRSGAVYSHSNSSASSVDSTLAFGAGRSRPTTSSKSATRKRRTSSEAARNALIGLGTAAAALAAHEARGNRQSRDKNEPLYSPQNRLGKQRPTKDQPQHGPMYSGSDEEAWESATDSSSSANEHHGLAFGDEDGIVLTDLEAEYGSDSEHDDINVPRRHGSQSIGFQRQAEKPSPPAVPKITRSSRPQEISAPQSVTPVSQERLRRLGWQEDFDLKAPLSREGDAPSSVGLSRSQTFPLSGHQSSRQIETPKRRVQAAEPPEAESSDEAPVTRPSRADPTSSPSTTGRDTRANEVADSDSSDDAREPQSPRPRDKPTSSQPSQGRTARASESPKSESSDEIPVAKTSRSRDDGSQSQPDNGRTKKGSKGVSFAQGVVGVTGAVAAASALKYKGREKEKSSPETFRTQVRKPRSNMQDGDLVKGSGRSVEVAADEVGARNAVRSDSDAHDVQPEAPLRTDSSIKTEQVPRIVYPSRSPSPDHFVMKIDPSLIHPDDSKIFFMAPPPSRPVQRRAPEQLGDRSTSETAVGAFGPENRSPFGRDDSDTFASADEHEPSSSSKTSFVTQIRRPRVPMDVDSSQMDVTSPPGSGPPTAVRETFPNKAQDSVPLGSGTVNPGIDDKASLQRVADLEELQKSEDHASERKSTLPGSFDDSDFHHPDHSSEPITRVARGRTDGSEDLGVTKSSPGSHGDDSDDYKEAPRPSRSKASERSALAGQSLNFANAALAAMGRGASRSVEQSTTSESQTQRDPQPSPDSPDEVREIQPSTRPVDNAKDSSLERSGDTTSKALAASSEDGWPAIDAKPKSQKSSQGKAKSTSKKKGLSFADIVPPSSITSKPKGSSGSSGSPADTTPVEARKDFVGVVSQATGESKLRNGDDPKLSLGAEKPASKKATSGFADVVSQVQKPPVNGDQNSGTDQPSRGLLDVKHPDSVQPVPAHSADRLPSPSDRSTSEKDAGSVPVSGLERDQDRGLSLNRDGDRERRSSIEERDLGFHNRHVGLAHGTELSEVPLPVSPPSPTMEGSRADVSDPNGQNFPNFRRELSDQGKAALDESPPSSRGPRLTRAPSSTSVPLRFRNPRVSIAPSRESPVQSPGANDSPPAMTPVRPRSARPSSTEFKKFKDFRPLYLVERNRKLSEPEESYPSLPSSRSTSRSPSVQDSEDAYESALEEPGSDGVDSHSDVHLRHDANVPIETDDILDSGQTTPKAAPSSPRSPHHNYGFLYSDSGSHGQYPPADTSMPQNRALSSEPGPEVLSQMPSATRRVASTQNLEAGICQNNAPSLTAHDALGELAVPIPPEPDLPRLVRETPLPADTSLSKDSITEDRADQSALSRNQDASTSPNADKEHFPAKADQALSYRPAGSADDDFAPPPSKGSKQKKKKRDAKESRRLSLLASKSEESTAPASSPTKKETLDADMGAKEEDHSSNARKVIVEAVSSLAEEPARESIADSTAVAALRDSRRERSFDLPATAQEEIDEPESFGWRSSKQSKKDKKKARKAQKADEGSLSRAAPLLGSAVAAGAVAATLSGKSKAPKDVTDPSERAAEDDSRELGRQTSSSLSEVYHDSSEILVDATAGSSFAAQRRSSANFTTPVDEPNKEAAASQYPRDAKERPVWSRHAIPASTESEQELESASKIFTDAREASQEDSITEADQWMPCSKKSKKKNKKQRKASVKFADNVLEDDRSKELVLEPEQLASATQQPGPQEKGQPETSLPATSSAFDKDEERNSTNSSTAHADSSILSTHITPIGSFESGLDDFAPPVHPTSLLQLRNSTDDSKAVGPWQDDGGLSNALQQPQSEESTPALSAGLLRLRNSVGDNSMQPATSQLQDSPHETDLHEATPSTEPTPAHPEGLLRLRNSGDSAISRDAASPNETNFEAIEKSTPTHPVGLLQLRNSEHDYELPSRHNEQAPPREAESAQGAVSKTSPATVMRDTTAASEMEPFTRMPGGWDEHDSESITFDDLAESEFNHSRKKSEALGPVVVRSKSLSDEAADAPLPGSASTSEAEERELSNERPSKSSTGAKKATKAKRVSFKDTGSEVLDSRIIDQVSQQPRPVGTDVESFNPLSTFERTYSHDYRTSPSHPEGLLGLPNASDSQPAHETTEHVASSETSIPPKSATPAHLDKSSFDDVVRASMAAAGFDSSFAANGSNAAGKARDSRSASPSNAWQRSSPKTSARSPVLKTSDRATSTDENHNMAFDDVVAATLMASGFGAGRLLETSQDKSQAKPESQVESLSEGDDLEPSKGSRSGSPTQMWQKATKSLADSNSGARALSPSNEIEADEWSIPTAGKKKKGKKSKKSKSIPLPIDLADTTAESSDHKPELSTKSQHPENAPHEAAEESQELDPELLEQGLSSAPFVDAAQDGPNVETDQTPENAQIEQAGAVDAKQDDDWSQMASTGKSSKKQKRKSLRKGLSLAETAKSVETPKSTSKGPVEVESTVLGDSSSRHASVSRDMPQVSRKLQDDDTLLSQHSPAQPSTNSASDVDASQSNEIETAWSQPLTAKEKKKQKKALAKAGKDESPMDDNASTSLHAQPSVEAKDAHCDQSPPSNDKAAAELSAAEDGSIVHIAKGSPGGGVKGGPLASKDSEPVVDDEWAMPVSKKGKKKRRSQRSLNEDTGLPSVEPLPPNAEDALNFESFSLDPANDKASVELDAAEQGSIDPPGNVLPAESVKNDPHVRDDPEPVVEHEWAASVGKKGKKKKRSQKSLNEDTGLPPREPLPVILDDASHTEALRSGLDDSKKVAKLNAVEESPIIPSTATVARDGAKNTPSTGNDIKPDVEDEWTIPVGKKEKKKKRSQKSQSDNNEIETRLFPTASDPESQDAAGDNVARFPQETKTETRSQGFVAGEVSRKHDFDGPPFPQADVFSSQEREKPFEESVETEERTVPGQFVEETQQEVEDDWAAPMNSKEKKKRKKAQKRASANQEPLEEPASVSLPSARESSSNDNAERGTRRSEATSLDVVDAKLDKSSPRHVTDGESSSRAPVAEPIQANEQHNPIRHTTTEDDNDATPTISDLNYRGRKAGTTIASDDAEDGFDMLAAQVPEGARKIGSGMDWVTTASQTEAQEDQPSRKAERGQDDSAKAEGSSFDIMPEPETVIEEETWSAPLTSKEKKKRKKAEAAARSSKQSDAEQTSMRDVVLAATASTALGAAASAQPDAPASKDDAVERPVQLEDTTNATKQTGSQRDNGDSQPQRKLSKKDKKMKKKKNQLGSVPWEDFTEGGPSESNKTGAEHAASGRDAEKKQAQSSDHDAAVPKLATTSEDEPFKSPSAAKARFRGLAGANTSELDEMERGDANLDYNTASDQDGFKDIPKSNKYDEGDWAESFAPPSIFGPSDPLSDRSIDVDAEHDQFQDNIGSKSKKTLSGRSRPTPKSRSQDSDESDAQNPAERGRHLAAIPEMSREPSPELMEDLSREEEGFAGPKAEPARVGLTQSALGALVEDEVNSDWHEQSLHPDDSRSEVGSRVASREMPSDAASPRGSEVTANIRRAYIRSPGQEQREAIIRPKSAQSSHSRAGSTASAHSSVLRRVDRSASSDLRAASKRDAALATSGKAASAQAPSAVYQHPPEPPANYEPLRGPGKDRRQDMSDGGVFEAWGDARGSPRSPTKPPSMRKRQSMQIIELEAQIDEMRAENRALQEASSRSRSRQEYASPEPTTPDVLQRTIQSRDATLRDKDAEIDNIKASLSTLREEIARLTEHNEQLQSANGNLTADVNGRYAALQTERDEAHSQWQQSSRQLDELHARHEHLSGGMEAIVQEQIGAALAEKNAEIESLRGELDEATERIADLQRQIQEGGDDFLKTRDVDYFDTACQQLCQHVQQWVLRFSKFSDTKMCRLSSQINDEATETRLDNAVLDGSDVDMYLSDRVRRRDVFMSIVMTMIWEFIFTRYLFGMDRDQRQKLKALEKTLSEVGPQRAVAQWRATTLTLLSRREAFQEQRAQDTDAVCHEIYGTLERLLPPPRHMITQVQESLRNVLSLAVDVSIEMRTQRPEYVMLPPLQPEYDTNGELARKVYFNAALMNERSGETASNEELEEQSAVLRVVLFPLVVKKGNDQGETDDEVVVCPAQVLVARPETDRVRPMRMSNKSAQSIAPSIAPSVLEPGSMA